MDGGMDLWGDGWMGEGGMDGWRDEPPERRLDKKPSTHGTLISSPGTQTSPPEQK